MWEWIVHNSSWVFSGIGVAAITVITFLIRNRYAQDKAGISNPGYLNHSPSVQAGGDVSINISSAKDVSSNLDIRTGQHVDAGAGEGEDMIDVSIHGINTGNSADIRISLSASIRMLIDLAQKGLNLGNDAEIPGSSFSFVLRWVVVDEKMVEAWKLLPVINKQIVFALIDLNGEPHFCYSENESLRDIGVYDGMEARLFAIQREDSPAGDQGMLTEPPRYY